MRIDATHKPWLILSILIVIAATAVYIPYGITGDTRPKGGSMIGLTYGIIGTLMILYAAFLGARKKSLRLRMGSITWWMRGHLWLGTLALLMVLYHGAFKFGGPLTLVLMILLIIVVVSGLIGAALQHFLPGLMTSQVTHETTHEQIDHVLANLRRECYEIVWWACGNPPGGETQAEKIARATGAEPKPQPKKLEAGSVAGQDDLLKFYEGTMEPFFRNPRSTVLADAAQANLRFDALTLRVDPQLHDALGDIATIAEEVRQKIRQVFLHRCLHWWLILHVPLSMAVLVLMAVHAVMALYY